ncbi:MAG: transcriptional repressor LexA [Proteobacteria bacterium]|nr:transcriptional repressor LexA [Pseudomonadota bacterium]MCH8189195.1 transcriptional repressor LexA [Pseudomonadota bacterium]
MLTRKQHELLVFIRDRLEATGISPSFDEMKDALELRSKSGIHRLITGLEERGFIRRLPHRARALEVLKAPEASVPAAAARPAFAPSVIEGNFRGGLSGARKPEGSGGDLMELPFYGKIAAGTPIAALRDATNQFEVPGAMLGRGNHYALEIEGDSMVNAGILDGDIAIIQETETAENGSIVVALIDDEEATLKRLRRRGNSVALEAANEAFETRIFPPDRVKIQGRLVGLIRKY